MAYIREILAPPALDSARSPGLLLLSLQLVEELPEDIDDSFPGPIWTRLLESGPLLLLDHELAFLDLILVGLLSSLALAPDIKSEHLLKNKLLFWTMDTSRRFHCQVLLPALIIAH